MVDFRRLAVDSRGISDQEQKLRDRLKRSQQDVGKKRREKGSVLDLTAYKDAKFYAARSGRQKNLMDIVPFMISEAWYPKLRNRIGKPTGLGPGDLDYKLEVPIHRNVGEEHAVIVCLREAFGRPCAVCEEKFAEFNKPRDEWDKEKIKSLNAKWRCFYNVWDYNSTQPDPTFLIFDISYKMFEEPLLKWIEPDPENGDQLEMIYFSSLSEGYVIEWQGIEKRITEKSSPYIEAVSFEFLPRDQPYDKSVLDMVYPLDRLLIIPTPEEVQSLHLGLDTEAREQREEVENGAEEQPLAARRALPPGRQGASAMRRPPATVVRQPPPTNEAQCPEGFMFGESHNEFTECSNCDPTTYDACRRSKEFGGAMKRDEPVRPQLGRVRPVMRRS